MTTKQTMKEGFSLVEIMVAIAIIGMIMAVAIPSYNAYKAKAAKTATIQTLSSIVRGIEEFREESEGGHLPERLEDLVIKPSNPELAKNWRSYLGGKKSVPKDGWNKSIQYKVNPPGSEKEYELYSLGAPKGEQKGVRIYAEQE